MAAGGGEQRSAGRTCVGKVLFGARGMRGAGQERRLARGEPSFAFLRNLESLTAHRARRRTSMWPELPLPSDSKAVSSRRLSAPSSTSAPLTSKHRRALQRCRELHTLLEHCPREAIDTRRESIAPRHDQPDMPNLLCGAAAHGQQLGGRNRLTTLVIIITTHIGVTGLASYHRYRRIEHVHWITSKHWTGSPPIATVLAAER